MEVGKLMFPDKNNTDRFQTQKQRAVNNCESVRRLCTCCKQSSNIKVNNTVVVTSYTFNYVSHLCRVSVRCSVPLFISGSFEGIYKWTC